MCANKTGPYHLKTVIDPYNQPIVISLYIKYNSVVSDNGRSRIILLNIVWPFPVGLFRFLVPGFELLLTVRIKTPEIPQGFFSYNPHVKPVNLRDAYKEAKPELQPVMAAGASAPAVVSGKAKPKPKSGKKKK